MSDEPQSTLAQKEGRMAALCGFDMQRPDTWNLRMIADLIILEERDGREALDRQLRKLFGG